MRILLLSTAAAGVMLASWPTTAFARSRLTLSAILFLLGLLAGVVGVICQWVTEARIDRTVLQS